LSNGGTPDTSVIVVGGGIAAVGAALRAGQLGHATVLVEPPTDPWPAAAPCWVGVTGATLWGRLVTGRPMPNAVPAEVIRLHDGAGDEAVDVADDAARPMLLRQGDVLDALAAGYAELPVRRVTGAVERLVLEERGATVEGSSGVLGRGKFLLLGGEAESPLASQAGLLAAGQADTRQRGWEAVFACEAAPPGLHIVVRPTGDVPLVAAVVRDGHASVAALGSVGTGALQAAVTAGVARLKAAGVLAVKGDALAARGLPVGGALELDHHTGKRTLLIDRVGGFLAAFSGEAVFPLLRSAMLAAEVVGKALSDEAMWQDRLAMFEKAWRRDLAQYLRMPNTDLGLLLPLVFRNEQMARRMVHAFVRGQDI
jgi:flavin-dependent dehydrogenase